MEPEDKIITEVKETKSELFLKNLHKQRGAGKDHHRKAQKRSNFYSV